MEASVFPSLSVPDITFKRVCEMGAKQLHITAQTMILALLIENSCARSIPLAIRILFVDSGKRHGVVCAHVIRKALEE